MRKAFPCHDVNMRFNWPNYVSKVIIPFMRFIFTLRPEWKTSQKLCKIYGAQYSCFILVRKANCIIIQHTIRYTSKKPVRLLLHMFYWNFLDLVHFYYAYLWHLIQKCCKHSKCREFSLDLVGHFGLRHPKNVPQIWNNICLGLLPVNLWQAIEKAKRIIQQITLSSAGRIFTHRGPKSLCLKATQHHAGPGHHILLIT